jgi:hypothetical protein
MPDLAPCTIVMPTKVNIHTISVHEQRRLRNAATSKRLGRIARPHHVPPVLGDNARA